ncbi:hypothetical protein HKBW3S09_00136 [Candidatus Hakubella thermalkaliphila]|uniref:DUF2442 domain-containing protein n=1 Tax=Candidatus Hakubella thermalkaliphila TaxID=2754717 RepID=A0A6V8NQR7_9ACTN|nr:DUF2442 domain-containing protein [Candidatus Hakubella thermalkaliphila]GFP22668.1 hypothetical protein HKBW3S09_00136 [Candidatus Hakubella thermalkaliphila]GFP29600.1 hypothetical protein HKBW3S34_00520 [Candidatus Hakubella thermalkaliphila]GFP39179.1 hypothetical protein HKBW3S47_00879 [Candidatus Hakubella thermalkaliphila]
MPTLIDVKPLDNYRLWVKYSDGIEGIVDLSDLVGKGVFAPWKDYREFQKVHIGQSGEIAWSEEIDLCPDAIYLKITGRKSEDLFPKLRELAILHA